MTKLLPRIFYNRSPDTVAQALLGKIITHDYKGEALTGRITEVEAYLGRDDPASHAFIGRTARNAVLFGPPGIAYIYFIYGMHYCLNVSCLPEGQPGGVLFRALTPISGAETMAELRGLSPNASPKLLTGGPGKLCEALGITRDAQNGLDVTQASSPLRIADDGYRPETIKTTARIGIKKAADRPLRFLIDSAQS